MPFTMQVREHIPMTDTDDMDEIVRRLLLDVGYLPKKVEQIPRKSLYEVVAYRLFMECFMANMERYWTADDLAARLETSKVTIYKHLKRLNELDILEEGQKRDATGKERKAYRIRYGDIAMAWRFVEVNVDMALKNMRKTVEHLSRLSREDGSPGGR